MIPAPKGPNENKRLQSLKDLDVLLDTAFEKVYDDLTKLASLICEVPIALVSLIDGDRQWFKSRQGLDAPETPRDISFCGHVIHQDQLFEVENATKDERFHDNPLVTGGPEIRFYAGYPLTMEDGSNVGTLCVIDRKPKALNAFQKEAMGSLGRQVANLLKLRRSTQKVREISDHVKSGLVLVDAGMRVQAGFSRSCLAIFGEDLAEGDCIAKRMGLSGDAVRSLQLDIEQVFSDIIPEDVTLMQIPSRFTRNGRTYDFEPSIIRDSHKQIKALLFTIDDTTDFQKAQKEAQESAALLQVARDKARFRILLDDFREDMARAEAAAKKADSSTYRTLLHTFKGNFLSFGIYSVGQLIHEIEEKTVLSVSDLQRISIAVEGFLERLDKTLGVGFKLKDPAFFEIRADYLQKLENFVMAQGAQFEGASFLRNWLHELKTYPVGELLTHVLERARRIAVKLGKDVEFTVVNGDLPVNPKTISSLLKNLVHLINNAVDHGVETPAERGSKSLKGRIEISFARSETLGELVVTVSDDGRGIDPESIARIAINRGIVPEQSVQAMSSSEKMNLIFLPNFSSVTTVTEISGRGVGLTALANAVTEAGGRIQTTSVVGQGTQFCIHYPEAA